ncbi:glycoside hydrolase family 32 protein [Zunongwangia sp. SCSIO 43204]|uniref:glycoside hydrolase family 32 protein n=1 Tax=Zunongwangia sp. SCSIO 43204 TaxID=2779359 RepID=UPI001CA7D051|nr:glycoside hydrolase family 32 protein [Zunongwangia sp. SCSIO 43204]UAB84132.1 glycoside hydrolase family 32 protein [Zunongwangia sp. SCSIO 43204]
MLSIQFRNVIIILLIINFNVVYSQQLGSDVALNTTINEESRYRPNFHFTPLKSWMNDPNGMYFYKGKYHLFFQHYPEGNTWGPMHWGHAVTKDLYNWEHKPIAIYPDEKGFIFSGSAVVDSENTSGFAKNGEVPIIAMFTYHDADAEKEGLETFQSQAIAYSLDEGETWVKYKNNPVINNPGIRDFRDPKIQWDNIHHQWIMVLSAKNKTLFYSSKNLKDWKLVSEFGKEAGAHGGVWECPDFFPIRVEGSKETKWVLIQSLNPGAFNSGSGTQYFVGDFDGKKFTPVASQKELPENHSYWLDFGKDNYAGVTWSNTNLPENKRLFIGWMSNWQYAEKVPTRGWRSSMTIPRELSLVKKSDNTYRLFSEPAKQIDGISKLIYSKITINKSPGSKMVLANSTEVEMDKLRLKLQLPVLEKANYTFNLSNEKGDSLKFGYSFHENRFFIDRSDSGKIDFSESFAENISFAPRSASDNLIEVEILLDKTSIELFYDNGETVMTEIFFPNSSMSKLDLSSSINHFKIKDFKIYELQLN